MSKSIKINYVSHEGNHQVAIVLCPNICRRFLHLSKDVGTDDSWVLRDYIGGQQIVRRDHLDAAILNDIEKEVWHSLDGSSVLYEKHESTEIWKNHLTDLSRAFFNAPDFGNGSSSLFSDFWKSLG